MGRTWHRGLLFQSEDHGEVIEGSGELDERCGRGRLPNERVSFLRIPPTNQLQFLTFERDNAQKESFDFGTNSPR